MVERILIADDHSIIRVGLSIMIKKLRPKSLIDEAVDFVSVLDLVMKNPYDLIVLDINMPNGSFQQTFDFIKTKQPDTKVLVFSSQDESKYATRYLKMGADGFLQKMADETTVERTVEKVLWKRRHINDAIENESLTDTDSIRNKRTLASNPLKTLSAREMEIAEKLIYGESLKDISNELNLHSSTASTYKARIFKKLDVKNIPELIDVFRFYEPLL